MIEPKRTMTRPKPRRSPEQASRTILAQQDPGNEWNGFPPGTRVRCLRPDAYDAIVAAMVRDRIGVVSSLHSNSGKPVVHFAAAGKHKAYRWVPEQPEHLRAVARPVA